MLNVEMLLNEKLNGVELYFEGKPSEETRELLKANKFRWNRKKVCWYAKQSDNTLQVAEKLANGKKITAKKESTKSLYERVNTEHNDNLTNSFRETKEVTASVRKYIRKTYPEIKVSARTLHGSSISVWIEKGIFEYIEFEEYAERNINNERYADLSKWQAQGDMYRDFKEEENQILNAIVEDIKQFIEQYHYDNSNSMIDYFDTNFYYSVGVSHKYSQVEATEEQKRDIEDYYKQVEIEEEAERQRIEKAIEKRIKEREQEKIKEKEEQEVLEKQKAIFFEDAEVINLDKTYILKDVEEGISKPCDFEEVAKLSNSDTKTDIEIVKEVKFNKPESFAYFSKTLLGDIGILEGLGGSKTKDNRVNHSIDYYYMPDAERETVEFLNIGVAVYYKDNLIVAINPEGYDYARYCYLPSTSTKRVDSIEYNQVVEGKELEKLEAQAKELEKLQYNDKHDDQIYDAIKNKGLQLNERIIQQVKDLKVKERLYEVLFTNESIERQVDQLNDAKGKCITIVELGMFEPQVTKLKLDMAKYDTMVRLIAKEKILSIEPDSKTLIYQGDINIDKALFYDTETIDGFIAETGKFASFDSEMIMTVYKELSKQGIKPIYNTIYYRSI